MALNRNYGFDQVETNGPEYESMEIVNDKVLITFKHAENGFNRTSNITGFEIAGEDGVFVPAEARLNRMKVEVFNEDIKNPTAVRYCFRNFQIGNLANTRELPVIPFRTDRVVN